MPVLAVFCARKIISVSVTLQAGASLVTSSWYQLGVAFEWLQNRQLQIASGRFQLWMQGMGKLAKQAGRGKVCA